ncbi:hypothetical protein M9Y10_013886 [Tritrichomonas musculus]|uniref:Uncharacterized protein n=1 Tax=Tritrichomonas musculus TaxID=1915356 RepID=A0ABR2KY33_9EUKA
MYYIYESTFGEMPRMPDPEMMPNDVKRLRFFREHTFNKRLYFISESEMMIYRYYVPEEYIQHPSERSWDKLHPGCENGYIKEVHHKGTKTKGFELIPDDESKKRRVWLTLNDSNMKQLRAQNDL